MLFRYRLIIINFVDGSFGICKSSEYRITYFCERFRGYISKWQLRSCSLKDAIYVVEITLKVENTCTQRNTKKLLKTSYKSLRKR